MNDTYAGSILMISLHGFVSAEPELGKPDTGGQVVFVLELAKRFARLGYRVDVLTRRFEDQCEQEPVTQGLRVWRIPFGGRKFIRKEDMHEHIGDFVTNFLAAANAQGLEYDVVNSHYWDAGWAGQRISEELGISHIHTPHSLGWWKKQEMKGSGNELERTYRFDERIQKEFLTYRNCDHIIATSHQQVEILEEQYGLTRNHITLIPPGIDEGRYTPALPTQLEQLRQNLQFKPTDVYSVGRAATNKGYDLLIQALPKLRELVPDARLQLAVGANSDRDQERVDEWRDLAGQLGVGDHIHWLGYVEDEQMADYYRAGGVFALPSRYEPFGMTAVEAMACGTPSVLTVHGGLFEVLDYGTHALFADPKRPMEYAVALAMPMLYPRLRERLSIEGARYARRHFGWTGIAKRTLAIFDQFKGRYQQEVDEEERPA